MGNELEIRVLGPQLPQPHVERTGFPIRLGPGGIAPFDGDVPDRGGFEEDHGVIACELLVQRGAEGFEKALRGFGWPKCGPIHRATIAKQDPFRVVRSLDVFERDLGVKNRSLRGGARFPFPQAGKSADEQHGGGLGDDDHLFADFASEEVGRRGLPASRTPGEHDPKVVSP